MDAKLNLAIKRLKLIRRINLIFLNLTLLLFLFSAIFIIPESSAKYSIGKLRDNIEKSTMSEELKADSNSRLDGIIYAQEESRGVAQLYLLMVLGVIVLGFINMRLARKVRMQLTQEKHGEEEKQIPFGAAH